MGSCLVLASPDDGWEEGQPGPEPLAPHRGRGAHPSTKGGMLPPILPQPKAASDTDIGSPHGGLESHRNRWQSRSASIGQASPYFSPDQQPLDLDDPRLVEVLSFKLKEIDLSAAPKPGRLQPQTLAARSCSNSISVGSPRPAESDPPRSADSPLCADCVAEEEDEETSSAHATGSAARHRDRLTPSSHALTSSKILSRNSVNVEGRRSSSPAPTLSRASSRLCVSPPPTSGSLPMSPRIGVSTPPSRSARQGDLPLAQQIMQRNVRAVGSPVVNGIAVPLTSSGELPFYLPNLPRAGTNSRPGSRASNGPGPRPFSRSYQSPLLAPHGRRTSETGVAPLALPPPALVLC